MDNRLHLTTEHQDQAQVHLPLLVSDAPVVAVPVYARDVETQAAVGNMSMAIRGREPNRSLIAASAMVVANARYATEEVTCNTTFNRPSVPVEIQHIHSAIYNLINSTFLLNHFIN